MHFEVGSVHEAVKMIKKMSQRDLQAKFLAVYGTKTHSNNNNWLRRKLFEAIGVDPAKGAVKKAAGGGAGAGGRRRRGCTARGGGARAPRAPRAVAAPCGSSVDIDWFAPRSSCCISQQQTVLDYERQQFAEQYIEHCYEQDAGMEEDEDHSHVAEALLALGDAVSASLEESCRCGGGGCRL